MSTKNIPNLLTVFRIVFALLLLFFKPFSAPFICLYLAAGLSDMLDGFLARKLSAESAFGSKLDSVADFVFAAVCVVKILPVLKFEHWVFWAAALVFALKLASLISGLILHKRAVFLHTAANKLTGLLLFVFPLTVSFLPLDPIAAVLCSVAVFAALQELHFIRKGRLEAEQC